MTLINKQNIKTKMFTILLILCCVQNISIVEIEGAGLKLSHLFSLLFIPFIKNKIKIPNVYICIFYITMLFVTILGGLKFGVNSLILNYVYGFYLLIIILNVGKEIKYDEWIVVFRKAAIVIAGIVIVNDYIQRSELIQFISNPFGHPSIDYLFGGGANLESTWISLFLFAFYDSKLFLPYLIFCFGISAIYASRVGMLIVIIFIAFRILAKRKNISTIKVLLVVIVGIAVIGYMFTIGMFDYILSRFEDIGFDSGSLGRLAMWQFAGQAIVDNPFGVGIGNALNYLRYTTGIPFVESNMHNLFMQMFVELGWFGGLYYLNIVAAFFIKQWKQVGNNAFIGMLYAYIFMSLFQFRGGEPLIFFVLGVYVCNKTREDKVSKIVGDYI